MQSRCRNAKKKSHHYNRTKSKFQNFSGLHKHKIEIDVQTNTSSEYFNRHYYKITHDFLFRHSLRRHPQREYITKRSQYNRRKSEFQNFLWVHKHEIGTDMQANITSEYFNHHYYKIIHDFYFDTHSAHSQTENISQKAHIITEQSQNFKSFHKLTNIKHYQRVEKHIF